MPCMIKMGKEGVHILNLYIMHVEGSKLVGDLVAEKC